jgi:hypothetical protein
MPAVSPGAAGSAGPNSVIRFLCDHCGQEIDRRRVLQVTGDERLGVFHFCNWLHLYAYAGKRARGLKP